MEIITRWITRFGKLFTEAFGGALAGAVTGAFLGALLSGAVWCVSIGGFWVLPKSGDMAYALTLGMVEGAVFGAALVFMELIYRRWHRSYAPERSNRN